MTSLHGLTCLFVTQASHPRDMEQKATSARGLRREASRTGLLFASLGGMIGSGWLFGALNAAKIAGPAALISWVIGGVAVLLLAFVFAELSTMFPRPGAVVLFPKLCFGPLAAQVMSWINFLAYVAVAPVEAVAIVSYANNFAPGLVSPDAGTLTVKGVIAAAVLMAAFNVINLLAIRLVLHVNNAITWWKLAVPVLTIIALMAVHFRAQNFFQHGFAPAGIGGTFAAVSGSGIIFTFLGFRQAIELAGESAHPSRNLPFAIVGSVLLCILLYCGLQIAFIGALSPGDLAKGWAALSFPGISGPFAGLAGGLGLTWLAATLYADAAISPGGTGIIYVTTAARVVYATADAGLTARRLTGLSAAGVPVPSLILAFLVGLLFLAPLPSWRSLVTYLSSIGVLAYGIGPVVFYAFRRTLPEAQFPRPFRLRHGDLVAVLAFIVANLVVFWAGASVTNHLFGGLLAAFLLYAGWQLAQHGTLEHLDWRGALWLAPYFFGLWLITFLGPLQGTHLLGPISGPVAVAVFSLLILRLASACALTDPAEARARFTQA
jgi:amino acid transporter